MGGPTCEVLLEADNAVALDTIDGVLFAAAERVERTRKSRVWDVCISDRWVHVSVEASPPSVSLAAFLNGPEDFAVLRQLSGMIASALSGIASEPEK